MIQSDMTAATAMPVDLEAIFRKRTRHIQMLPAAALKALEIAKNPDCSITEFTAVVERDVKLATDVLAMANSPLFFLGRPISSLHQSVVRLGLSQCRNLILIAAASSIHRQITLHEEWIRELLRRHSFITAMLAINVNRAVGAGFQGEEFAAGLIHDIGRTLFAICLPEQFSTIDQMDFDESLTTLNHEESRIGTNHCVLGSWFGRQQNLPQELLEVILFHHDPARALQHRRLVALISACDHMANYLQRTGNIEGYDARDNQAIFVLEGCGVRNAAGRLAETSVEIMRLAERDTEDLMN